MDRVNRGWMEMEGRWINLLLPCVGLSVLEFGFALHVKTLQIFFTLGHIPHHKYLMHSCIHLTPTAVMTDIYAMTCAREELGNRTQTPCIHSPEVTSRLIFQKHQQKEKWKNQAFWGEFHIRFVCEEVRSYVQTSYRLPETCMLFCESLLVLTLKVRDNALSFENTARYSSDQIINQMFWLQCSLPVGPVLPNP